MAIKAGLWTKWRQKPEIKTKEMTLHLARCSERNKIPTAQMDKNLEEGEPRWKDIKT